jgi:hypothetical protein
VELPSWAEPTAEIASNRAYYRPSKTPTQTTTVLSNDKGIATTAVWSRRPGTFRVTASVTNPNGITVHSIPATVIWGHEEDSYGYDSDSPYYEGDSEAPYYKRHPDDYTSDKYRSDKYRSDKYIHSDKYNSDKYDSGKYRSDEQRSDKYKSDKYRADKYRSEGHGYGKDTHHRGEHEEYRHAR